MMQGLFKHMKGAGEPARTYEDYDDAFGSDSSNLSNQDLGNQEGMERFKFELTLADQQPLDLTARVKHLLVLCVVYQIKDSE